MEKIRIKYQAIDRRRKEVVTRERGFSSEEAMQKWLTQQEALVEAERGGFIGVLAYSWPDGQVVTTEDGQ